MIINLSPFEKDRIVPDVINQTDLARTLMYQDYLLKQLVSTSLSPDLASGQAFWKKVYQRAYETFGTTDIPVNSFHKVWIVPNEAKVFAQDDTVMVTGSTLKVMLEEDYLARKSIFKDVASGESDDKGISTQVLREVILPLLEEEVNKGQNFAALRQVYNAMILAVWYKNNLKDNILNRAYADQAKLQGLRVDAPEKREELYQRYLEAYRKGVYNFIREETNPVTGEVLPRKYFAGGADFGQITDKITSDSSKGLSALFGRALALCRVKAKPAGTRGSAPALTAQVVSEPVLGPAAQWLADRPVKEDQDITEAIAKRARAGQEYYEHVVMPQVRQYGVLPADHPVQVKAQAIFAKLKKGLRDAGDMPVGGDPKLLIINSSKPDAYYLPGTEVVVMTRGFFTHYHRTMMEDKEGRFPNGLTDDHVAGVMAHELVHYCQIHLDHDSEMLYFGEGRQKEEDADRRALDLSDIAGFNPKGLREFFDSIGNKENMVGRIMGLVNKDPHPAAQDRSRYLDRILEDTETVLYNADHPMATFFPSEIYILRPGDIYGGLKGAQELVIRYFEWLGHAPAGNTSVPVPGDIEQAVGQINADRELIESLLGSDTGKVYVRLMEKVKNRNDELGNGFKALVEEIRRDGQSADEVMLSRVGMEIKRLLLAIVAPGLAEIPMDQGVDIIGMAGDIRYMYLFKENCPVNSVRAILHGPGDVFGMMMVLNKSIHGDHYLLNSKDIRPEDPLSGFLSDEVLMKPELMSAANLLADTDLSPQQKEVLYEMLFGFFFPQDPWSLADSQEREYYKSWLTVFTSERERRVQAAVVGLDPLAKRQLLLKIRELLPVMDMGVLWGASVNSGEIKKVVQKNFLLNLDIVVSALAEGLELPDLLEFASQIWPRAYSLYNSAVMPRFDAIVERALEAQGSSGDIVATEALVRAKFTDSRIIPERCLYHLAKGLLANQSFQYLEVAAQINEVKRLLPKPSAERNAILEGIWQGCAAKYAAFPDRHAAALEAVIAAIDPTKKDDQEAFFFSNGPAEWSEADAYALREFNSKQKNLYSRVVQDLVALQKAKKTFTPDIAVAWAERGIVLDYKDLVDLLTIHGTGFTSAHFLAYSIALNAFRERLGVSKDLERVEDVNHDFEETFKLTLIKYHEICVLAAFFQAQNIPFHLTEEMFFSYATRDKVLLGIEKKIGSALFPLSAVLSVLDQFWAVKAMRGPWSAILLPRTRGGLETSQDIRNMVKLDDRPTVTHIEVADTQARLPISVVRALAGVQLPSRGIDVFETGTSLLPERVVNWTREDLLGGVNKRGARVGLELWLAHEPALATPQTLAELQSRLADIASYFPEDGSPARDLVTQKALVLFLQQFLGLPVHSDTYGFQESAPASGVGPPAPGRVFSYTHVQRDPAVDFKPVISEEQSVVLLQSFAAVLPGLSSGGSLQTGFMLFGLLSANPGLSCFKSFGSRIKLLDFLFPFPSPVKDDLLKQALAAHNDVTYSDVKAAEERMVVSVFSSNDEKVKEAFAAKAGLEAIMPLIADMVKEHGALVITLLEWVVGARDAVKPEILREFEARNRADLDEIKGICMVNPLPL
ncbi:MAG: M48 family metalloprotease [Candidatus Omnitrophica bacterium]|nr:M48 family metalloprotease [Candidatus Omnitrophota bacterium]